MVNKKGINLFDERKVKKISDELYFIENGKHRPEDVPVEHRGTTREATAEKYGISPATVARLLRIDKLINEFTDGSEVLVECEATELDKRLLPVTKIAVPAYRTHTDDGGNPADSIIAKTLNY